MDSLDRLSHSLEAAIALIHSLRRENRDLARSVAEKLQQEPAPDLEAQERCRQAELEAARLSERLDEQSNEFLQEKRVLEAKIQGLELRILAAEREEVMPLPDRGAEIESLSSRCAELEIRLSEALGALEKSRGDITALQVRIAESADPEEVSAWQARIHDLGSELESLRHLSGIKERLEADRMEVKKQKRLLAGIHNEREMTRKKLEEIFATLDNLRLS